MIAEVLTTDHMVDDTESVNDAMEAFRKVFGLVGGCYVLPDGRTMLYNLKRLSTLETWLQRAKNIIAAGNLPLEASGSTSGYEGGLFAATLTITYKPLK